MEKTTITGAELNTLIAFLDGSYAMDEPDLISEIADGDMDHHDTIESVWPDLATQQLLKKFWDWKVRTSDDGSRVDSDFQMYDNFLHLVSPNGVENIIEDRHCLVNGFEWDDELIIELDV